MVISSVDESKLVIKDVDSIRSSAWLTTILDEPSCHSSGLGGRDGPSAIPPLRRIGLRGGTVGTKPLLLCANVGCEPEDAFDCDV